MTDPAPNHRWYHFTPARFFIGLLVVQVLLFLSEQFQWFPFNEHKGWTVLIAMGVVLGTVAVMLLWGLVCLLLRRRFQFSFRALLVFLVAVSVPLGWFAWELQRARRQREAVVRILALDGGVFYDYELDDHGRWIRGAETTTPGWLMNVLGSEFFCEVVMVSCEATEFGDNDAKYLQELANIERLLLDATPITDNGLAHLKEVTELDTLSLFGTQVTDAGLAYLKGMPKLRSLSLDFTDITDAGLEHLKEMTSLQFLYLRNTSVTLEGVERLRETLPTCRIRESAEPCPLPPLNPAGITSPRPGSS